MTQVFGIVTLAATGLSIAGTPVKVTALELDYFKLLAKHAGTTLTKPDILAAIYGDKDSAHYTREVPEPKIVDVVICKLRSKLAKAADSLGLGAANPVNTVWGVGYNVAKPFKKAA